MAHETLLAFLILFQSFRTGMGLRYRLSSKSFLAKTQHTTHAKCIKICMSSADILCGRLGSSTFQDPRTTMRIWDTSASFGLTPFKSDLIDYLKFNTHVKYVTNVNTVIGIGTKICNFVDANGKYILLPCIYYHLPTTDVQLFSPQTYHQLHGAHSIIKRLNVQMVLKNHNIVIPINI